MQYFLCRKYKESVLMVCLTNMISQLNLDISPIWTPLIRNEVTNSEKASMMCQILHEISFWSRVLRFYSTDSARVMHRMVSQILHLILFISFHGLGLLHEIFTSFSILVSCLCMFYHNFYCILLCSLSFTQPGLRFV
jgi:hypothetical protein